MPDTLGLREPFAAALAGQYDIETEIGRGGMGVVYLARDLRLDRRVAIKTLPPHLAADPVVRERFLREARTAARLSHQNIVPIHRADELGGFVFFVMGFVDGESLAQRIRDRGALDPREVLREMRDVADALAYAHDHGVIHRDVKAENILIDRATGRAMVTDFGIARLAEAQPLTATGQVLGTVYYLSPEQVAGEVVDRRSDIYSLGVTGFFALSGRFPFDAALASAVLIAHVTKQPPLLRTLASQTPAVLADIVDRCLAKDPAARFASCGELVEALTAAQNEVEAAVREAASAAPQRLVSDAEAQAIWERAAALQAMTGATPRPVAHVDPRDTAKDAALTSGYQLGQVRDAAREAGIPTKYVDQVIVEHGLAGSTALAPIIDRSPKRNPFIGARTRLEFEVVVDGEMSPDDYDLMVDVIRRETGEVGALGAVGRSFSWQTNDRRKNLQVSVFPRGGKTTIRVSENLRAVAGGILGGIVGGYGGGTAGVWFGIGAHYHNPLLGLALWAANAGILAYGGARTVFAFTSKRHAKSLQTLAESLAAEARATIAARKRLSS